MSAKVLILVGGPRKYGSSAKLAEIAAKGVSDAGGRHEVVYLYDYDIRPCLGCVSDDQPACRFPCPLEDDFNKIASKLVESDGLVLSTPVYWYAPTGVVKNFIDRLTSLENMIVHEGRSLLDGKVAGFIATGVDSGVMMALSYMMVVLNSMGALIPPWAIAYTHQESVESDEQALRDAYNVGFNVAAAAKALKAAAPKVWYRADVDLGELAGLAKKVEERFEHQRKLRSELLRKFSAARKAGSTP